MSARSPGWMFLGQSSPCGKTRPCSRKTGKLHPRLGLCLGHTGTTLDPWWKACVGASLSPASEHRLLTGLNSGGFRVVDVLETSQRESCWGLSGLRNWQVYILWSQPY